MDPLIQNFWQKRSKYIQVLSEWNELRGFAWGEGNPSFIGDIEDSIAAFKLVKIVDKDVYGVLTSEDLKQFISFMEKHKVEGLKIYDE